MKYVLTEKSDPRNPEGEKKVYGVFQCHEVMDLETLHRNMRAAGCKYDLGEVYGVVTALAGAISVQLAAGNEVDLGELGKFSVQYKSKGVDSGTTFNPNVHLQPRPVWIPSKDMAAFHDVHIKYSKANSRKEDREIRRQRRSGASTTTDAESGNNA